MTREELVADCRRDAEAWYYRNPRGIVASEMEVINKLAELMADKAELLTTIALHAHPKPARP